MRGPSPLRALLGAERRRQGGAMAAAIVASGAGGAAAIALLGLSGWFIAAAWAAGLAPGAFAFDYLLPAAGVRAAAIVRTAGRYGERLAGHTAALRALAAVRAALFLAIARAPAAEALGLASGEASARLVEDVEALQIRFVRLPARWGAAAAALTGLGLAALAGPWPALVLAVALAGQAGLASALARAAARGPALARQAQAGVLRTQCAALLAAAPEIAAFDLAPWAAQRAGAAGEALERAALALERARGWQAAAGFGFAGLGAAGVLALAQGAGRPLQALAGLAALAALEAVGAAVRGFDQDMGVEAAEQRLDPWFATPEPGPVPAESLRPEPAFPLAITGADGRTEAFAPGERLALVGPSGCGKTRLIEGFLRLRAAPAGRLAIGGRDVAALSDGAARAAFALAPQAPTLLDASVRENLLLAAPQAQDDELWAALEAAALADRIAQDPAGLDADVGPGGARLSGGERKRLALARAYLRPAPWLVLDEPTEGLDASTEREVVARLRARLDRLGQGLILVSHRPAPLALCERRLSLEPPSAARAARDLAEVG